jgi:oligopeptidase B
MAAPICVAPRETGIEYDVDDDAARDRLIIVTNWHGDAKADDFQIVSAPVPTDAGDKSDWQVVRAHRAGCLVLNALPFKNHMAVLVRENALPRIILLNLADNSETGIAFDEEAYDVSFGSMAEYDSANLRFTYASMTTPTQTFDYDMDSDARVLRKTQNVPSGHDAADYITRRITATGHDGAQIPVSLLYHKDTPLDASAPVLLYGYGSYGITIPAAFSVTRLSLVDRGFVYAIAHIRGGRACGHNWFMQGRGQQKTNTFRDFVSSAEALIEGGFTKAGQISIHGGSAGGLLVGASVNLAPHLFCSAIAEVPFVDVLTTMLDASLPLTPPEWPEWGNPIESADAYALIAGYAPYENIEAKAYPHILATGGLTDPRVTYWEPAKWIARLRATRQDDGLSLLRTEMTAGHGGKAGRFNQLHEIAFVYAFVLLTHGQSLGGQE